RPGGGRCLHRPGGAHPAPHHRLAARRERRWHELLDGGRRVGHVSPDGSGDPDPDDVPDTVVYVIDDDAAVCESVSWLLGSIDITPEVHHRADTFLEAYDGSHPACLILDMRMPRMSGARLQTELNESAP